MENEGLHTGAFILHSSFSFFLRNLGLPAYNFSYLIQLHQRLHRREVVDVDTEYLLANLSERRIVELEEA